MEKFFNITGSCDPDLHYMVDLSERFQKVRSMVDQGQYFCINRARQYGKTTLLTVLSDYLEKDYHVVSMDFQTMSSLAFESEQSFVSAFSAELLDSVDKFPDDIEENSWPFQKKRLGSIPCRHFLK